MIGLLLLLQAVPPAPVHVALYHEMIMLRPGRGRTVSLEIRLDGQGTVRLPLAWRLPDSVRITSAPEVRVTRVSSPGTPRVELRSEAPAAVVRMVFDDSAGSGLRYRLVNGTEAVIDTFRLDVSLAPGTVPASVRYNVPAADSAPGRHVLRLDRADGARAVRLDLGALAAGDAVELAVGIDPERKSWIPLLAAALITLVFLIRRHASVRPAVPDSRDAGQH